MTDAGKERPVARGDQMKATQLLHDEGQSLWLDNITRDLLDSGTLKQYIDGLFITGLTSNPTIFDHAIKNSDAYDASIAEKVSRGKSGEALFFERRHERLGSFILKLIGQSIDVNAFLGELCQDLLTVTAIGWQQRWR
jgi:hypothetical protein